MDTLKKNINVDEFKNKLLEIANRHTGMTFSGYYIKGIKRFKLDFVEKEILSSGEFKKLSSQKARIEYVSVFS